MSSEQSSRCVHAEMEGQSRQPASDQAHASGSGAGPSGSSSSAASAQTNQQEAEALDEEEIVIYKRRIVDILQPGETVLEALRRLGVPAVVPAAPGKPGEAPAVAGDQHLLTRGRRVPVQHR